MGPVRLLITFLGLALGVASAAPAAMALDLPAPPPAASPPTTEDVLAATLEEALAVRGREAHLALVGAEARRNGIPVALAEAVVTVESAWDPAALGALDEVGLMQVRPGTAAMLGFRGSVEGLRLPANNVRYGVRYLAQAWRLADGDLCTALMKYRAGHGETRMSARSVAYCVRAIAHLKQIGSPLADAEVPQAVAVARRGGGGGYDAALWRRHRERMQAIESRLPSSALSIAR
ncbi:lytic transglycosylase domain-containing protein [Salinarimonas rosea]|uniref:lytic transglycosylase domain-containing protein n=1 Tax=Salinarimonas rosea TaxID=552063 RepID=UPI000405E1D4|nr:lytic transglycosylase domain-containing protein [Salinarimonas rosea]